MLMISLVIVFIAPVKLLRSVGCAPSAFDVYRSYLILFLVVDNCYNSYCFCKELLILLV
jgi:hypothetical protein